MNRRITKGIRANPLIILREEFDDQSLLFDPETGHTFAINPIGVLLWKNLDGHRDPDDLAKIIRENAETVSSDVMSHIEDFLKVAVDLGLACYEVK